MEIKTITVCILEGIARSVTKKTMNMKYVVPIVSKILATFYYQNESSLHDQKY